MCFIEMSPNNRIGTLNDRMSAILFGESFYLFNADSLATIRAGERVTFVGHGGTNSYGDNDLTPEQFADALIDMHFPFHLKPLKIDLIGCETGLLKNNTTYAERFVIYLNERLQVREVKEKYHNQPLTMPEVRTFASIISQQEFERTVVAFGVHRGVLFSGMFSGPLSGPPCTMLDGDDARKSLDVNPNFLFTPDIIARRKKLDPIRQKIWYQINNQMALQMSNRDRLQKLEKIKNELEDNKADIKKIRQEFHKLLISDSKQYEQIKKDCEEFLKKLPAKECQQRMSKYSRKDVVSVFCDLMDNEPDEMIKINILKDVIDGKNPLGVLLNEHRGIAALSEHFYKYQFYDKKISKSIFYILSRFKTLLFPIYSAKFAAQGIIKALQEKKGDGIELLVNSIVKNDYNEEIVRAFLESKGDINQTSKLGNTPLLVAVSSGHTEVVDSLIECKSNVNKTNKDGWTPLLLAVSLQHVPVVTRLIKSGANVNQAHPQGGTALFYAVRNGNILITKQLLEVKGIDVNKSNPAHLKNLCAKTKGNEDKIISLFKEKNKGIEPEYIPDFTPLHTATILGHTEIVFQLLRNNADLNKTALGITPVEMAQSMDHSCCITLLDAYKEKNVQVKSPRQLAINAFLGNLEKKFDEKEIVQFRQLDTLALSLIHASPCFFSTQDFKNAQNELKAVVATAYSEYASADKAEMKNEIIQRLNEEAVKHSARIKHSPKTGIAVVTNVLVN